MSERKKVGETKNFLFWEKVFIRIKEESQGAFDLDGSWEVIQDHGLGDHDGMSIVAVFMKDGRKVNIEVEWIPTQDAITKIVFS